MFNFIVSSSISKDINKGSISVYRVFEYTPDYLIDIFFADGGVNERLIRSIPSIITGEDGDNIPVIFGYISNLVRNGGYYEFYYNKVGVDIIDIYNMREALGISDFEFHRNHWAIKDVDLFRILYHRCLEEYPRPRVFKFPFGTTNENLVSLMMPFNREFYEVYSAIRAAVENEGYECRRADDLFGEVIINDIASLIYQSKFVICDLSGRNPNVFYETGVAHAIGKSVILIAQSEHDIPFDVRHLRYIIYQNNEQGRDELAKRIVRILKESRT